jgi:hypothetical protein
VDIGGNQSSALDYRPSKLANTIGNSPLVRFVATVASVVLIVLIVHFLQRSRETLGGLADWILPMGAALVGAVYCACVSLNIAGRTRPGSMSWIRRGGGIVGPAILMASAAEWVRDVRADPYATKHALVVWIIAAIAAWIVAIIIAIIGLLHWDDRNGFPSREK